MRNHDLEKVIFTASLVLLAFLYGFVSVHFEWFPSSFLNRAVHQGHRLVSPPSFTAPRVYDRGEGARVIDPEQIQPGLTLVSKNWKSFKWRQGLKLIGRDGRTVHEWPVDLERVFPDSAIAEAERAGRPVPEHPLHGAHLFPDGDVLLNIEYVGTARLDACGRVLWRLPAGNHHSIHRGDDGSFWTPAATGEPRRTSPGHPDGLPGLVRPMYQDQVLQLSEDGAILQRFNVLDLLYANGLERQIVKARRSYSEDPTHLNDVEPLPAAMADEYPLFDAGDVLVSLRNLDLVLVFDPKTERVKWHESHPFIAQHDPDFVEGGWIGVFDNNTDGTSRGTMLGGSRIVAIQPHTDSMRVLYPSSKAEPFYTDIMGKWQMLANGNLLLTEARAGRIVEVAPDGSTVWEWFGEPHGEERTAEITEGTRYGITLQDVASWPCSKIDAVKSSGEETS